MSVPPTTPPPHFSEYDRALWHLEQGLRNIDDMRRKIVFKANQSRATPMNLRLAELVLGLNVNKAYKAWLAEYTTMARAYPDKAISSFWFDGIYRVQEFNRKLRYAERPLVYFHLEPLLHPLYCACVKRARTYMAGRINWVQNRLDEGKDPYTVDDRYRHLVRHSKSLQSSLAEHRKWIIDPAIVPELELLALMVMVGNIDYFNCLVDEVVQDLRRLPCEPPAIEEITTDCTSEAMATTDKTCAICSYSFGPTFSDALTTEPAVKSECNHILGKQCLQTWINENNTCPFCRRELYDRLPATARPLHRKMLEERKNLSELDAEIDRYFLEKPKMIYGTDMKDLLDKLKDRYREMLDVYNSLHEVLAKEV